MGNVKIESNTKLRIILILVCIGEGGGGGGGGGGESKKRAISLWHLTLDSYKTWHDYMIIRYFSMN